jgi:hypothetical protein
MIQHGQRIAQCLTGRSQRCTADVVLGPFLIEIGLRGEPRFHEILTALQVEIGLLQFRARQILLGFGARNFCFRLIQDGALLAGIDAQDEVALFDHVPFFHGNFQHFADDVRGDAHRLAGFDPSRSGDARDQFLVHDFRDLHRHRFARSAPHIGDDENREHEHDPAADEDLLFHCRPLWPI